MKFVQGQDVCKTHLSDIIHGCNAQGKMGSGVAEAVREAFPGCYETYIKGLQSFPFPKDTLGVDFVHEVPEPQSLIGDVRRVHNLITQLNYGYDGKKYATYYHILKGIELISVRYRSVTEFAIPKIGCSLGGLQWPVMEELLRELEDARGIEFWVYSI
jgi:hypothetical protein